MMSRVKLKTYRFNKIRKKNYIRHSQGRLKTVSYGNQTAVYDYEIDWTYDLNSRLIKEVFDHYDDALDQTLFFDYDSVGNRLSQTLDKGNDGILDAVTNYLYDENDRLIEELFDDLTPENKDRQTNYGYDHTQQTSKVVSENGIKISETTFEYDAQGRMAVVTIVTGNHKEIVKYEYDSNGIRISAEQEIYENDVLVSKTKTEYLNDSQSLTGYSQVLKQTETNIVSGEETITTYVIGHQRISQTIEINETKITYYFTFDGHGSTRVLLDAALAVAQLYSFDAYGNALGFNPDEALTEFLYSGEQFDSKIGQQYLRQRYYDPNTGRFNRLDPFFGNLNDPLSLHKYTYVHNDPVNGVDPSGFF
jgi:RHS repeat-associated protein